MVYGLTPYVEVAGMKDKIILRDQTIQDKEISTAHPSSLFIKGRNGP